MHRYGCAEVDVVYTLLPLPRPLPPSVGPSAGWSLLMVVSFLSSCRFAIFGYNISCSFLLGDNCLLSLLMSGLCTSLHLICCNNSGQGVTRGDLQVLGGGIVHDGERTGEGHWECVWLNAMVAIAWGCIVIEIHDISC